MCRLLDEGLGRWWVWLVSPGARSRFGAARLRRNTMVTDLMTDEELLAFAKVLGERDEGSIELAYSATGIADEISQMPDSSKRLFERLAEVSNRPIIHQAVVSYDHDSEQPPHKTEVVGRLRKPGAEGLWPGADPQVWKKS